MKRSGTKLAWLSLGVLVSVAASSLAGCLVTDEADVRSPGNTPPTIVVDSASPPLEEVIVVDTQRDPEATTGSLTFEAQIREPDLEDTIQWFIYVDERGNGSPDAKGRLFPASNREVRLLEAPVARSLFATPGCHRIELRVSREFAFSPRWLPEEEGDIDSAVWWVFTKTATMPNPDPSSCPQTQ